MPNTIKYRINSKKSLCKSKKEKKCKKIKGCKMAKGPKKTFCRKIKNKKYGKTKKKRGGVSLGVVANMASKSPLVKQAKERFNNKIQNVLSTEIPIDESKLEAILSKLDEKKIEALMDGIKNIDAQTINKIKSGDKKVIMKMIMQNPELQTLLIGKLRQELTKNPEMQKLAMEVMRSSMKGGEDFDRSKNSVDALKRLYIDSDKKHDDLDKIMMDPKESIESKRAAQQLLMEKYIKV